MRNQTTWRLPSRWEGDPARLIAAIRRELTPLVVGACLLLLSLGSVGCSNSAPETTTDSRQGQAAPPAPPPAPAPPPPPAPPAVPNVPDPARSRDETLAEVERLEQRRDFEAAGAALKALLVVDPDDVEVIFRLANVRAMQGDLPGAVEWLQSIPADHPEAGIPALGQAADWLFLLERYDEAESSYRKILDRIPDLAAVHRKLAFLYNRQGRRHEAAEHVYELCRQGNVLQDELHSLIQLSDAMFDPPSGKSAAPDQRRYVPIGASGMARKRFTDEAFSDAVERLRDSIAAGRQPPSIVAFFGRAAAEAQDDEAFRWWLQRTDERTRTYAEYWAALGTALWTQHQPEQAVRALLEALDRDPSDFRSIARLRAALKALGRDEEAERWSERWKTLRDVFAQNNLIADSQVPNIRSMENLAKLLESLDRRLESIVWRYLAGYYAQAPQSRMQALQVELRRLVRDRRGLPDRERRLCGMRLDEFPLPPEDWMPQSKQGSISAAPAHPTEATPARFENAAESIGLNHAYQVASASQDRGFSVYQSIGGGVAALDYDLDGQCDLYFAQGAADPPEFIGNETNSLYRQFDGRLVDASLSAGLRHERYSTGVTVGDWNQDGWPDIVVANIGSNAIWINRGDGTFQQVEFDNRDDKTLLTTSLAMADLNADALPDVFELNYLHDPELSKRPERDSDGRVIGSLMPADFQSGMDRLIYNDSRGRPGFQPISQSDSAAMSGLGVIVGDFDPRPGNEVFVGNDTDPNQLWVQGDDGRTWSDLAMSRGCAFAHDGVPTASMGIAAGDFDRSGSLDFHVTNFQDESVSLFLREGDLYQDRNVRFNLAAVSDSVLGFGTQAIDYDNNGWLDLVVTNGHIEQAVTIPAPFEQPPQLFAGLGNRFELVEVADGSGYWNQRHVGRGLARLDFDRDGRTDFVITHLGERSALMINRTETQNHWLQLQLVGTESERDAIGARVDVKVGDQVMSHWVVAGDGFFARNEPVLSIGLGAASAADEISIRWPSGRTQRVENLPGDRRWLIVESQAEASEI